MDTQEELTQLEAERDRLRSMIAYHHVGLRAMFGQRPSGSGTETSRRTWSMFIVTLALSLVVCLVAYFLTDGTGILFIFCNVTFFSLLFFLDVLSPPHEPAGEPQVLQRLAECEAQIVKLRGLTRPGRRLEEAKE